MKKSLIHLMNWWARPFPHINAVVLSIFASILFVAGIAVAFHPYITEVFEVLTSSQAGYSHQDNILHLPVLLLHPRMLL